MNKRRKLKAMVIGYCPNCKKSTRLKVIDTDAMWNCTWQCQECGATFTDEERKEQSKVKGVLRKSQKDLSGKEYEMVDLLRGVADELTANVAQIRSRGIRMVDPVYLEGCVRKLTEVIEYTKSLVGKPSVTGRKKRGQRFEVGDEVFGYCPECRRDTMLKIIDEDAITGESVLECQRCGEVFTEEERRERRKETDSSGINERNKRTERKKVGKVEGTLRRKIRISATKWMGSTKCDICGRGFAEVGKVFYDGKTIKGSWAVMCRECFTEYRVGVGTGRGQMYDSKTLEKVGG